MSVPSLTAAKSVCELSSWSKSNLEIQKILYLAHMALVGRSGGQALLVDEMFEAWDYGPVLPSIYHEFKIFGGGPVKNMLRSVPPIRRGAEAEVIREAVESLRNKSAGSLIANTHWQDGAWYNNYHPGSRGVKIPTEDILAEYKARVGQ